jgi:hypothetical protein
MCNESCIECGKRNNSHQEFNGRSVLEVGSLDVNGSLRPLLEEVCPRTYVGIDIITGPGVDQVCSAEQLIERFGAELFEAVVSTEMLEHFFLAFALYPTE